MGVVLLVAWWDVQIILTPFFDEEHLPYCLRGGTRAVASLSKRATAWTVAASFNQLSRRLESLPQNPERM